MAAHGDEERRERPWATPDAAAAWQAGAAERARLLGPATERLLELAAVGPGSRVLDVAAGTGDQTLLAARRAGPAGSVLATDLSAPMLAVAADLARREGLANVTTRVLDAQDLDLAPTTFDAVISRFGLMCPPDLPRALAGIRRVLVPGGRLAAMVWSAPERNPLFALPLVMAERYGAAPPAGGAATRLFAPAAPGHLARALQAAGFRDVAVHQVPLQYRCASLADFFASRGTAAGPLQAFLEQLNDADRARARAELEREFGRFGGPDGVVVPGEALIGVGTR